MTVAGVPAPLYTPLLSGDHKLMIWVDVPPPDLFVGARPVLDRSETAITALVAEEGGSPSEADFTFLKTFGILRDSQFSITSDGTVDAFREQLEELADSHSYRGKKDEAESIRNSIASLVSAREKHGSRYLFDLQAAIQKSRNQKAAEWEKVAAPGVEGATRQMFNNEYEDPLTGQILGGDFGTLAQRGANSGSPLNRMLEEKQRRLAELGAVKGSGKKKRGAVNKERNSLQKEIEDLQKRVNAGEEDIDDSEFGLDGQEGESYTKTGGNSWGSAFRDANGKVTIKSLVAAPMTLLALSFNAL